jgi:hypothetical protein
VQINDHPWPNPPISAAARNLTGSFSERIGNYLEGNELGPGVSPNPTNFSRTFGNNEVAVAPMSRVAPGHGEEERTTLAVVRAVILAQQRNGDVRRGIWLPPSPRAGKDIPRCLIRRSMSHHAFLSDIDRLVRAIRGPKRPEIAPPPSLNTEKKITQVLTPEEWQLIEKYMPNPPDRQIPGAQLCRKWYSVEELAIHLVAKSQFEAVSLCTVCFSQAGNSHLSQRLPYHHKSGRETSGPLGFDEPKNVSLRKGPAATAPARPQDIR